MLQPAAGNRSGETEGWNGEILSGYVFLAVDNIELRREFCEVNKNNMSIKAVFDIRTGLTDAQHFAADWNDVDQKENLINSMQFSHEDAMEETPVSACGNTLGIVTTVRLISAIAVNNYIKFVKGEGNWTVVILDGFTGLLECYC